MKKLVILLVLAIMTVVMAVSCGEDEGPSQGSVPSTQSTPAPSASSKTDTSVPDSTPSIGDEGGTDVSSGAIGGGTDVSSGAIGGGTDVSSGTGTSSSADPLPEPDPEPEIPEPDQDIPDGPITISEGGATDYVVVYDGKDIRVAEFANRFVEYMKNTHGITFPMVESGEEGDTQHCIYVGNIRGTKRTQAKLNATNDFGACVSGNDYVLYATNSRLYEYLYEMLTTQVLITIRDGSWSTMPKKDFIYHSSSFANKTYVDYAIEKSGGELNKLALQRIFESRTFVAEDGTTLVYRLYIPYDYDPSKKYPVLTYMHGAGERGNDNSNNLNHMMTQLFTMENSPLWDSIVLVPQCPNGQQWVDTPWADGGYRVKDVPMSNEIKAVFEILDMVKETLKTDENRYYLMGLSMGGFATWDMIMRRPEMFAAAVPICGGGDYTQAHLLVNMPIYTLHDKKDAEVPMTGTKEMVVALETLGSTVIHYEELSGYGHNVWGYAASKPEIWFWLFEQNLADR